MPFQRWHLHRARGMAIREEPRMAPALGFVGVDRKGIVRPPAGMNHMIRATADRSLQPGVPDVEDQGRVDWNGRVQARGGLPGAVADSRDVLAAGSG